MTIHKKSRTWFLMLAVAIVWLLSACDWTDLTLLTSPVGGGTGTDPLDTQPVLKNLVVTFGEWDPATGRAGDFHFMEREEKVFLEFGAQVTGPDGPKVLPTFEYRVDIAAPVLAPCDGIISDTLYQSDTGDYEVWIVPSESSTWMVIIDHVTQVEVIPGQKVTAGTVLGKPGTWSDLIGRVELMIFKTDERLAYAPFAMFDAELRAQYEAEVWQFMQDWETFKGDTTLYDQPTMRDYHAGCLADTYLEG